MKVGNLQSPLTLMLLWRNYRVLSVLRPDTSRDGRRSASWGGLGTRPEGGYSAARRPDRYIAGDDGGNLDNSRSDTGYFRYWVQDNSFRPLAAADRGVGTDHGRDQGRR